MRCVRNWWAGCLLLLWCAFSAHLLWDMIPEKIYIATETEQNPSFGVPSQLVSVKPMEVHYVDTTYVYPSGETIGIYMKEKGVLVVGVQEFESSTGKKVNPAEGLLEPADVILSLNDTMLESKEQMMVLLQNESGAEVELSLLRNQKRLNVKLQPEVAMDGVKKLGIWVRDDVAGIGTMTCVTEEGSYMALGHEINDIDTGHLMSPKEGGIYESTITEIVPGKRGESGMLNGILTIKKGGRLASIESNSECGITGEVEVVSAFQNTKKMEIGYKQEIKRGTAYIWSDVSGEVEAYEIQIEAIDFHPSVINKGIFYRVTDEKLLALTGGIVQGMSGSPIIQDGKLVGAVTHVLVNDPTRGYGIFIENMLDKGQY